MSWPFSPSSVMTEEWTTACMMSWCPPSFSCYILRKNGDRGPDNYDAMLFFFLYLFFQVFSRNTDEWRWEGCYHVIHTDAPAESQPRPDIGDSRQRKNHAPYVHVGSSRVREDRYAAQGFPDWVIICQGAQSRFWSRKFLCASAYNTCSSHASCRISPGPRHAGLKGSTSRFITP